uniref:Major facilitator superfamily (MFS) profile domain-containing protein n=1 Tax=Timema shepardi TaxID=629360 RepID=A0A7R9G267_TIMSH|nr:unnamed protein product [Timema shepardi]
MFASCLKPPPLTSYIEGNPNYLSGSSGDESKDNGGPGQGAPALGKGYQRKPCLTPAWYLWFCANPTSIPTFTTPTPARRTSIPTPLHPSNPFLPLPTPTLVTPAIPTSNPIRTSTPEDDTAKLKNCVEILKDIPGLDPWDISSSLLRKVQKSSRSNCGHLNFAKRDNPSWSSKPHGETNWSVRVVTCSRAPLQGASEHAIVIKISYVRSVTSRLNLLVDGINAVSASDVALLANNRVAFLYVFLFPVIVQEGVGDTLATLTVTVQVERFNDLAQLQNNSAVVGDITSLRRLPGAVIYGHSLGQFRKAADCNETRLNKPAAMGGLAKFSRRQWLTLVGIGSVYFASAICISLQAPFYPQEAERKGATATEYGLVFGVFELVAFLCCPIFGKYINVVGAKTMLNVGIFVAAISCMLFG